MTVVILFIFLVFRKHWVLDAFRGHVSILRLAAEINGISRLLLKTFRRLFTRFIITLDKKLRRNFPFPQVNHSMEQVFEEDVKVTDKRKRISL